jgi:hypothetical protein
MLFEIIAALALVGGLAVLSRTIGRRNDVLYYVSKPDPRARRREPAGVFNTLASRSVPRRHHVLKSGPSVI